MYWQIEAEPTTRDYMNESIYGNMRSVIYI
uniref:Uncharacterized protein n=1 Tax=Nelumbo nucifera TaxID=4432 RepID=A0A822XGK8_NELNU|nr:TPA_asm: hypothetical protein HUJ06_019704 [Nelumbo nucifera]